MWIIVVTFIILVLLWLYEDILKPIETVSKPILKNEIFNKKNINNQSFNDLLLYLSKINNIHNGGCGISAYIMYKWLKNNNLLPDNFTFVFCYNNNDKYSKETNERVIKNKKGDGIAPMHVGILINKYFFDCSSELKKESYSYIQEIKNKKDWFILNTINNVNTWNSSFNRNYVKNIENEFKIDLSEIRL